MPKKLAFNPDDLHPFWYKQNVSPPKSMERWDDLIRALRADTWSNTMGSMKSSQWYFEVWNEPNIDFWGGIPRDKSYFELYRAHGACTEGGLAPASASEALLRPRQPGSPEFLNYAADNHVPVDFVSTHGYADETVEDLFGHATKTSPWTTACAALRQSSQGRFDASPHPLPLFWTEWNVPGKDRLATRPYVGPALANTIRECDGLVDMLSFWTFSDVFEEGGPISRPFEGHFGLRAKAGINKPSFYAFGLLHRLGDRRLANAAPNILVTRRRDGSLAVAAWNLVDPGKSGSAVELRLSFEHVPANARATMSTVDNDHGNTLAAYRSLGSPQYPTPEQVRKMNAASALPAPAHLHLDGNHLDIRLQVNALALIEIPATP